jgi:site-specific DNA recombinase
MAKPSSRTRVLAYVRVSTSMQAEKGVSLEAQHSKVRAYADLYDLDLVDVVVDAAASAKTLDRPGLRQVLAALRAGDADALLVIKLDRLTRSVRDLCDLLERSKREGWALMSVGEQIDTSTAAGRMVVNILGVISQWERETIGERTSAAMQHMKGSSEFTGGKVAPYGYQVGADGVHLVAVEHEQTVIVEARRLRSQGRSLRQVAVALAAAGMLNRAGKTFQASQIARMIEADTTDEAAIRAAA